MKTGITSGHIAGRNRFRRWWWAACAVAVAFAGGLGNVAAQDFAPKKSVQDLVAESEWIAVADLVSAEPRRNARGNLIVTDLRFRTAQTLLGSPGAEFMLTQGGGTLNGESQEISDTPELAVGQRYLLFVRPGRGEMFAPFVGGAQGAFALTADGKAMSLGDHREMSDTNLFDDVNRFINERGAAPVRIPQMHRMPPGTYPAKTYKPIALASPITGSMRAAPSADASYYDAIGPQAPASAVSPTPMGGSGTSTQSLPGMDYHYEHAIAPPATINGFPHDWTPWWPEDEYQLADWNFYGGNVFLVYTNPTNDWSYGNDVFDLAGWPDDATMIAQFGEAWCCGYSGITYKRWFGDGPVIEADTALNPAYCWTLDDRYATNGSGDCEDFRQTMRHEVGHSWGLKHPWEFQDVWWDSIMNYSPGNYRFPHLLADDTNAVRAAFGGVALHDALLSLYSTGDDVNSWNAAYTSTQIYDLPTMRHGTDLSAWITNSFKIENLGTDDIVTPTVQFWLSQQRMDWSAGSTYLGSAVYATVPVFTTWYNWLPYLPIPSTTPTGNYWFSAYIPDADANMGNNSAWADEWTKIHVDNNPTTLYPQTYWQTSEAGFIGPAGDWTFTFAAVAGTTYYFSTCGDYGGFGDFDTTIAVEYFGTQLAFDDDTCGTQSFVTFTAPYSSDSFTLRVTSYDHEYQGSFWVGYRRDLVEVIFYGGFDP